MKVNYHTHTYRCKHADGIDEDFVKVAISRGLEKLGFSDHAPFDFGDHVSTCRMNLTELDGYFESILDLKHRYRDYIEIFIGFEIEYSRLFDSTVESYKKYQLDYMILGQHYVGCECDKDMVNMFHPTRESSLLSAYVDECLKGVDSGKITYVAHPDCVNFVGNYDDYDREMGRFVDEMKSRGVPLEINLLGIRKDRNYPNERFLDIVGKKGAKVIIGADAHLPIDVMSAKDLDVAFRLVDRYKLELLEDIKLKKPF